MLNYRRDITNVISTQSHLIDICFNQLEYKLDTSFASVNTRFNTIDTSFASVNTRFNTIDATITQLSYQFFSPSFVNNVNQTFYEIITQQPYKFDISTISIDSTSIVLRWNYDSIIAKHSNNNIAKLANVSDYTQNLPFINQLIIELFQNNIWTPMTTINITSDYNVDNFKRYTLQRSIINYNTINNMPFSVRVYGRNYSSEYPNIEARALVFENLIFSDANHPSKPLYINSIPSYDSNVNNIILTYFNTLSDISNALSSVYVNNYSIDYSLNDTLASTSLANSLLTNTSLTNIQNSITSNFSDNINSYSNFNVIITNLMSGANYNHRVKIKNNYSNIYSDYTTISGSIYTLIPNDNSISSTIDMSIKAECYKYVTSNSLNNSNILYFNIDNNSHSFMFNNSSSQVFQITHPYFNNQQLETNRYGYGKFIDNSFDLVTINVSINSDVKQVIKYGGFNTTLNTSLNSYNYTKTGTNNLFILDNNNNINIEDIYGNSDNFINKGFRLKGYLLLKQEITNTNIINYFGVPSTNPYIMNINYQRSVSVNNSFNSNIIYPIYIDQFIGNPSITNVINSIIIEEVIYNMSVASVKYFKVSLARRYNNINSNYKYIVGNGIIAKFLYTNTISTSFSIQNIILPQLDICANGVYNYDLSYSIAFYQPVKNNYSFNLLESVYNLNGNISTNISLETKPFCDYNSFSNYNNIIVSSKLKLNEYHIYEISNIAFLGSDLSNIVLIHYDNHSNPILPCTLLYLDSCFNNVFTTYPNSSDFSYNNLPNILYTTHGDTSYDLSGIVMNNNQGYKWIVFKIFKNSNSYLFNNTSYNIRRTSDSVDYLPLKLMLEESNLFLNSTVYNIFDVNNSNAVMFGHATTRSNSYRRYFNIKQIFKPGGIWDQTGFSNNITYNITANSSNFGSNVYDNGISVGIYCQINNLNNDLTIYIGLKG